MDNPPRNDRRMLRLRSISKDKGSLVSLDFESERKETKTHGTTAKNTISSLWFFGFICVAIPLYALIHLAQFTLPTPLTREDVVSYPEEFNTERTREHLTMLTQNGPRVLGSYENEYLAAHYIKQQLDMMPTKNLQVEIQRGAGCYYLPFKPFQFTNCYDNLQNIVARLEATNRISEKALMINCHFDSVPTSPGASDDGINCAIMLEMIYLLTSNKVPLKHDIIFLFNGAEESPLQASHLFITQHRWAKDIGAFINLEAAGAGGREILFQTGPNNPWLVKAYAQSVYHPFGVVAGEEIFQSGLIPSDTDFRIFRDHGNVAGLDFAFAMNGFIYHTKYDSMDYIPNGTYQHAGDNIYALTKQLANAPQLDDPKDEAEGHMVYFDILGIFMISYSETTGYILNAIWIVLSLISVFLFLRSQNEKWPSRLCSLAIAFSVQLISWIIGILFSLLIAFILDSAEKSLSWYTRNWFIVPLYYLPTIVIVSLISTLVQLFNKKKDLKDWTEYARYQCVAQQVIWTIGLLILTAMKIRSAYILAAIIWMPSLILIALSLLKTKGLQWLAGYSASYILSVIYIMSVTVLIFGLFIPISARSGPFKNPDLIVSILASFLAIATFAFLCPLTIVMRHRYIVLGILSGVFLIFFIVIISSQAGFPFAASESGPSPQRVQLMHFEREIYNAKGDIVDSTSGFWLMPQDRVFYKSLSDNIQEVAKAKPTADWCDLYLSCGLPIFAGRQIPFAEVSHWLEAAKPIFHMPLNLHLTNRISFEPNKHRLEFSIHGPDHMALILSPRKGVKIIKWSFPTTLEPSAAKWKEQDVHFVQYTYGTWIKNWEFFIELEADSAKSELIDLAVTGNYRSQKPSPELKEFISIFPDWAHISAWNSNYRSFIF